MADNAGQTVLALPAEMAATRESSALTDVRSHTDPDLVLLPGPDRRPQAAARARQFFDVPVVHPPLGGPDGAVQRHEVGPVSIIAVQRASTLREAASECAAATAAFVEVPSEATTGSTTDAEPQGPILVCDDVGTTIDRTTLTASLDHAAALAECVPPERSALTVLSGRMPADYDRCWLVERGDGTVRTVREPAALQPAALATTTADTAWLRIRGTGSIDDYSDVGTVTAMDLQRSGQSNRSTHGTPLDADRPDESSQSPEPWPIERIGSIGADSFGIRAVDGVGAKTAKALAERGIRGAAELLETPVADLASLPGIGEAAADRMREHARVLETGEPRRLTTEPLPAATDTEPPLCLDIETDGLSPTIIWQIGVYDSKADEQHAFVERTDPTDPGDVIEAFLEWLLGNHPDRTLLTWNGWRFDYTHLGSFVERYVPQYREAWQSISKRDLYRWAVTDDNAVLPGRTNALDDVADALGYEGGATGLDGAATAAAYSRFIRTGEPLAWDRHERYCEDDCRALWAVYEQVGAAPIAQRGSDPTPAGQTGLGDFCP